MIAKVHMQGKWKVLAACDDDLLGKTLVGEVNGEKIEFEVNEMFYGGDTVDEDKLEELLKDCTTANLVGKQVVEVAKRVYDLKTIFYVSNVPYTMVFKLD